MVDIFRIILPELRKIDIVQGHRHPIFSRFFLPLHTQNQKLRSMKEVVKIDSVDTYNRLYGVETLHPLVSVFNTETCPLYPGDIALNFGIYAIFLKQIKCGELRYGRRTYDFQDGTVTSFAPGQVVDIVHYPDRRPKALVLVFHPDLIHGTALGQRINQYSFFSYASSEALHLSEEERDIFRDCLVKIQRELEHPIDKYSNQLIVRNIELLLDYCLRFYDRQFETRSVGNKDVLVKFESLLDAYLHSDKPMTDGLPTVKYFADQAYLSSNYFGDLIKKETGQTAQAYIQSKLIDAAKEDLLGTDMTINEIAYRLGFQYPQHLTRIFKKSTGLTPTEYRAAQI